MRKLLLASAATVGLVGTAVAQTPPAPTEMLGIPSQPSTYLGGNNSLNSDGGPLPSSPSAPTPGTMTIHLNGRVWGYLGVQGGTSSNVAGNKVQPEQFIGYFRLYPGVDALATNGLRYGAIVEIRQNYVGQAYGLNITAPPGTSNNGAGGNYAASPSGASCGSTLYVRREALYMGSDQLGIVRIGQDDGPFSQFDNGVTTMQTITGAWNGDAPDNLIGSQVTFPFWSGVGNEYTPSKVAYFSPRFAGFDLGASFAPNNAPNTAAACPVAGAGCATVSTATLGTFGGENRATNWYEVMGRYQGNFGGLGIYGILGYSGSGHVHVWGSTPGGIGPGGTASPAVAYNGFSVGDGGLALTYAGFTVGGNVLWGAFNGQVGLKPQGGVNAVAWVAGAQYAVGPLTISATYMNYQSQGNATMINKSQSYNDGLSAGVSYAVAPGLMAYAEYIYGQTHQGGVNQITGSAGSLGVGTSANNDWHGQSFILGTRVQW